MPAFGGPELIVIVVLVLIVFGAGKLPNVMTDLGKSVREMRDIATDANAIAPSKPKRKS